LIRRRFSTLRFVSLLAVAALVVHDLRYRLGYQEHAGDALREEGHAYLCVVATLVGALLAVALACLGALLLRARRGGVAASARAPLGRTWAYSALLLATIYAAQEWLEGQFAPGHPAGLAGVVCHAGWVALLLGVALGAAIALLLCGADAVLARVLARARPRGCRAPSPARRPPTLAPLPLDVLARHLAGRGPPLLA
jgi:hypothetical protein